VRLASAQTACTQLTTLVRVIVLLLGAVLHVQASQVRYDLQFLEGPGGFALQMLFDDEVPDREHAIMATVTLTPGRYTGDIVAVYLNLNSSLALPPLPPLNDIAAAIEGVHITNRAINTSHIQGGEMGTTFSIGLAIGQEGIGKGKGDIQALSFLLNTPGLMLQHLGSTAVRVLSIGPIGGTREYSAKLFDVYGEFVTQDHSGVPEPGSWVLAGCGLCALAWFRAAKK
jgi:hypothetical protein